MSKFNEHDIVVSVTHFDDVPVGTSGTVVHVHNSFIYVVEFFVEGTSVVKTVLHSEIENE